LYSLRFPFVLSSRPEILGDYYLFSSDVKQPKLEQKCAFIFKSLAGKRLKIPANLLTVDHARIPALAVYQQKT